MTRHIIALVVGAIAAQLLIVACFRVPVEVHNPHDERGTIQPLATVAEPTITFPVGSATAADGTIAPIYRTEAADDARQPSPPPAPFPWASVLQTLLAVLGAGAGGWGVMAMRAAKTAVQLTADYADAIEGRDPEDLDHVKKEARRRQEAAGVHRIIQKARGKA